MPDSADGSADLPAAAGAEPPPSTLPDVVPPLLAARWEQASNRLFGPLVMDPDHYQQVVLAMAELLDRLRVLTPSIPALLEVAERTPQLAAEVLERAAVDGTGVGTGGVDPDTLALAALAQRHRELYR